MSKQTKSKKKPEKMSCIHCKREISLTNFYKSTSPMFPEGKATTCKDCIRNMVDYDDINTIYSILQSMDIPFLYDIWGKCEERKMKKEKEGVVYDVMGNYIRQINSLSNYEGMSFKDSIYEKKPGIIEHETKVKSAPNTPSTYGLNMTEDELCEKWGYGYTCEELIMFEKKYRKLVDGYGEKTAVHIENLTTYVRFRVKEELATAKGDPAAASKWATMANDAAKNGKITVQQMSKSDISGGIDLVPQLMEAVESKLGIISILPKLKEQPYDDADLIIWAILNYSQRLEDKPRINYRDIWSFYDEMLIDFYQQKGYNDDQIKVEKEKRNAIYRDLSKVYIEPLYNEGDVM